VTLLGDQNYPVHAEFIGDHAETQREERFGKRHRDLTAFHLFTLRASRICRSTHGECLAALRFPDNLCFFSGVA
jgi:hypothetical protein